MTGSFKERGAANLLLALSGRAPARRRRRQRGQPWLGRRLPRGASRHLRRDRHARVGAAGQGDVRPPPRARRSSCTGRTSRRPTPARARSRPSAAWSSSIRSTIPRVIAGQGTIGLELLAQVPDLDAVLVPVGGGGLIGGIATAIKAERPAVKVIGVQSGRSPAMRAALAGDARDRLPAATTIADGIAVRRVGVHTLALARRYVDEVVTVSEEEIANAILLLLEIEKTVVEGAGAVPLAALANRRVGARGQDGGAAGLGRQYRRQPDRAHHRARPGQGRPHREAARAPARQPGLAGEAHRARGRTRANVLGIGHDRAFSRARLGETRGRADARDLGGPRSDRRHQAPPAAEAGYDGGGGPVQAAPEAACERPDVERCDGLGRTWAAKAAPAACASHSVTEA